MICAFIGAGSYIATSALDFRNVPHLTMVESAPADQFRPKYHDYIYPLPGDYNLPTATPVIFEVARLRQVTVQVCIFNIYI
jgi:hypothetical protein